MNLNLPIGWSSPCPPPSYLGTLPDGRLHHRALEKGYTTTGPLRLGMVADVQSPNITSVSKILSNGIEFTGVCWYTWVPSRFVSRSRTQKRTDQAKSGWFSRTFWRKDTWHVTYVACTVSVLASLVRIQAFMWGTCNTHDVLPKQQKETHLLECFATCQHWKMSRLELLQVWKSWLRNQRNHLWTSSAQKSCWRNWRMIGPLTLRLNGEEPVHGQFSANGWE